MDDGGAAPGRSERDEHPRDAVVPVWPAEMLGPVGGTR